MSPERLMSTHSQTTWSVTGHSSLCSIQYNTSQCPRKKRDSYLIMSWEQWGNRGGEREEEREGRERRSRDERGEDRERERGREEKRERKRKC